MAAATDSSFLIDGLVLLGAAVVAVPLFKRLKLGAVLGYLAAGLALGPLLRYFRDGQSLLHFAELGVVLLLFIIGLELQPSRLWAMRRDIFALGLAQVIVCGAVLGAAAYLVGLEPAGAIVAGFALALSSTAFAMQLLEERGELASPYGQKSFAILLMQDLAIVPLLALAAVLSPGNAETGRPWWAEIALMAAAVVAIILAGRFLLNPMFRILANTRSREIFTAAALLVVLGAAALLQAVGMSMAMGAFLAGVMLAESSYRHELEADIEPFRGLLLGLFFMAVGMAIDLDVVLAGWPIIIAAAIGLMLAKSLIIYSLMRLFGSAHDDALRAGLLLSQGGEFAFVLFSASSASGLIAPQTSSMMTAIVIASMALTPAAVMLATMATRRDRESMEEDFDGAGGKVLLIGFGRFGQLVSQVLLLQHKSITVIDNDAERIREAARFGSRIYYGDGARLDVLRAAGAGEADIIAICTDKPAVTSHIVDVVAAGFPRAKLYVRTYDRRHTLSMIEKPIAYEMRETFESAIALGSAVLEGLGLSHEEARAARAEIRRRDLQRLAAQRMKGLEEGARDAKSGITPEPLTEPTSPARYLNEVERAARGAVKD